MATEVCVFEGEDAAPEAMRPTVELLEALDTDIELVFPPVDEHADGLGVGRIPSAIRDPIDAADAVLFGAARGDGDTYVHVLTYLRTGYGGGLPANVRPSRYLEGASSPLADPTDVDYVVVRENPPSPFSRTEDIEDDLETLASVTAGYDGGGILGADFAAVAPGAFSLTVMSEPYTRRLAEIACEFAVDRFDHAPIQVTSATKSTSLTETHGLFDDLVEEAASAHDELEYEHLQVDNVGHGLVSHPGHFDVVVAPNAEGDILSDVGAATVGGLGLAPSGNFGEDAAYFEPVHGTAPDIVGEGVINPTATILAAVMMLEYLGYDDAADRLDRAVREVYAERRTLTPDQGGSASTTEMVGAIADAL